MINVFYDDRCPLCTREIEYYKKITPPSTINWYGISKHEETLKKHGISLIESLKLLHATNQEGKMKIGVDAFILIWQNLPRWNWLATVIKLPIIYQISGALYAFFAERRFNNLDHCKIIKDKK